MTEIEKYININDPVEMNIKLSNIDGRFNSWKIPIDYLIFNPYNDRFAMEASHYMKNNGTNLCSDKKSQEFIEDFLKTSMESRNTITRDDILENGVLKNIVVDFNGVILDGNRRVTILRDILKNAKKYQLTSNQYELFTNPSVVVVEKENTEKEIRDLETALQISEDEKVEYDPINIYLKVNRLYLDSFAFTEEEKIAEVSRKMGARYKKSDIKNKIETFNIMNQYLIFIGKPREYMFLKKKEDHFKGISSFRKSSATNSIKLNKLKNDRQTIMRIQNILFSMTAMQFEGKKFRKYIPGTTLGKTPLQNNSGLQYVEEHLKEYSLLARKKPKIVVNKEQDEKIENIFKLATIKSKISDPTIQINNIINKTEKSSTDIYYWSKQLYGPHKISNLIIRKLKSIVINIQATIDKIEGLK